MTTLIKICWLVAIGLTFSPLGPWTLQGEKPPKPERLAPYVPTPLDIVEAMLRLGELQPGELHYDLGSGDGRIVVTAAQKFRARTVGFEIDPQLVAQSQARIHELGIPLALRGLFASVPEPVPVELPHPDLVRLFRFNGHPQPIPLS